MSDDDLFKHLYQEDGYLELETITAAEMLQYAASMFDQAPPGTEGYIDVCFEDHQGRQRYARISPVGEAPDDFPSIH